MIYVSYAQLAKDVVAFSENLGHYDAIIGVPRSGMPAASMLALHRNVALGDSESLAAGRFYFGGPRLPTGKIKRVLVLDDSVLSGKQMTKTKRKLQGAGIKIHYGCMYVKPGSTRHVDVYHREVPLPRIFEWNVFHAYWMGYACLDIDGVLCRDPSKAENDDAKLYREFITTVVPRRKPTVRVAAIVTSRLEKYRHETATWLAQHGIEYNKLIMHPAASGAARRKAGDHAQRKAAVYSASEYKLFVESSERQSEIIYQTCLKPVLCTDTGKFYA
jgi:orotate phosphoribosyltransferase